MTRLRAAAVPNAVGAAAESAGRLQGFDSLRVSCLRGFVDSMTLARCMGPKAFAVRRFAPIDPASVATLVFTGCVVSVAATIQTS
jgi:hypothetical protein